MSMADVTNAEIMGGMYGPNQFSSFPGKLSLPGYVGTPTDAQGHPIAPPPGGMTLNSAPVAAAPPPQAAGQGPMSGGTYGDWRSFTGGGPGGTAQGNQMAYDLLGVGTGSAGSLNPASAAGMAYDSAHQAAPTATSSAGAPAGSTDFNSALSMLANPGHVTTPGANVPQASSPMAQPDVLSHFLASQSGGTGAGGYSNKGFFDTLNALKSGGAPPQASSDLAPNPGTSLATSMAPVAAPGTGGGAPYIGGTTAAAAGAPADQIPGQFSPRTQGLLSAGGIGGLGGMGGMPAAAGPTAAAPAMAGMPAYLRPGGSMPMPMAMLEQPWHGMGSGNGGAAGNGSAGGQ